MKERIIEALSYIKILLFVFYTLFCGISIWIATHFFCIHTFNIKVFFAILFDISILAIIMFLHCMIRKFFEKL